MPSFTQAFTLNSMISTNLNVFPADQSLTVNPVANGAIPTLTSVNVTGTVASNSQREFMVNMGLNSDKGGDDKVVCFAGLEALPGTSSVWTYYSSLGMNTNSGSNYNAICYECDLDNSNQHRGNSGSLGADFGQANAVGLSVTGNSQFTSTTGILVSSQSGSASPQWARGITFAGTNAICSVQDWTTSPVAVQFDGSYSIAAINMTSVYGNPGAITSTALFMRNNMHIAWQNNALTSTISDLTDGGNNRIVGSGSAACFMGSQTLPLAAGFNLGSAIFPWGTVFAQNGSISPSDPALKTNINFLTNTTDSVRNVWPIEYSWADDPSQTLHYGFNADDVQRHIPVAVSDHDGVKWLAKDELLPVLWQTNRELIARIEALEAQIANIQG